MISIRSFSPLSVDLFSSVQLSEGNVPFAGELPSDEICATAFGLFSSFVVLEDPEKDTSDKNYGIHFLPLQLLIDPYVLRNDISTSVPLLYLSTCLYKMGKK